MKKSEYKEAIRTMARAKRYGVGSRAHALSPDREYFVKMRDQLRNMRRQ